MIVHFGVRIGRLAVIGAACLVAFTFVGPGVAAASSGSGVNPADFGGPIDNPYFPLPPGTWLVYKGSDAGTPETDVVHVTRRTRVIEGVPCVAVQDTVYEHGLIVEKTLDWYAQDLNGTVWYFGERTAEYDKHGNVTSREGSWQAGVNGALPGIIMEAHPQVGDTYRQEFLKGHAEDHAKVVSLDKTVTVPYGTFTHVLKTVEWSPLEPGVLDGKYYAPGIGSILESTIKGPQETIRLVQIIRN